MRETTRSRYRQLIERALFELKLARDCAIALSLGPGRIARLARARRELDDELRIIEAEASAEKQTKEV